MPDTVQLKAQSTFSTWLVLAPLLVCVALFVASRGGVQEQPLNPGYSTKKETDVLDIGLRLGESATIATDRVMTRMHVVDPTIIQIYSLSPYALRLDALAAGTTRVILTDQRRRRVTYDITVPSPQHPSAATPESE